MMTVVLIVVDIIEHSSHGWKVVYRCNDDIYIISQTLNINKKLSSTMFRNKKVKMYVKSTATWPNNEIVGRLITELIRMGKQETVGVNHQSAS